jgi:hypothetical protein
MNTGPTRRLTLLTFVAIFVSSSFASIQAHAGRLDLLLQDPETLKRYEVELQLGPTDETHIIRTIEYWDIEWKRYPQYEHTAVIVAEDITSRFLNVIELFNGNIPLVALKMTAFKVNDAIALTFVKVLDEMTLGLVDEDEPKAEPTTRCLYALPVCPEVPVAVDVPEDGPSRFWSPIERVETGHQIRRRGLHPANIDVPCVCRPAGRPDGDAHDSRVFPLRAVCRRQPR